MSDLMAASSVNSDWPHIFCPCCRFPSTNGKSRSRSRWGRGPAEPPWSGRGAPCRPDGSRCLRETGWPPLQAKTGEQVKIIFPTTVFIHMCEYKRDHGMMDSPGMTWTERAAVPNSPVVASTALSCIRKKTQHDSLENYTKTKIISLCLITFMNYLKGKGLRLHDSLQDHKTVRGHVDVAAVLNLILDIWIHTLTNTNEGLKVEPDVI